MARPRIYVDVDDVLARVEALSGERFDLAVEDNAQMALFLVEATGADVLLFDRPWNRDAPGLAGARRVTRVHSWVEILERSG